MKRLLLCLVLWLWLNGAVARAQETPPAFTVSASWIGAVGWSADGDQLLVVNEQGISRYASDSWTLIDNESISLAGNSAASLDLSPVILSTDGSTLIRREYGGSDSLIITNLITDEMTTLDFTTTPEMRHLQLQVSADGSRLAVMIRLFEPQEGGGQSTYRAFYGWDYDRPFIRLIVYDMGAEAVLREVEYYDGFVSMLLSPNGRWLVVSHGGNPDSAETLLYDIDAERETRLADRNIVLQDFSTDSSRFIATIGEEVYQWEMGEGFSPELPAQPQTNLLGMAFSSFTLSPDGTAALISNNCEQFSVYEPLTNETFPLQHLPRQCFRNPIFSPDGHYVAVKVDSNSVWVWELNR